MSSTNIRFAHSVVSIFFSSLYIHIRTLSTGGVHPLTSTSGIIHSHSEAFYLHIHGDLLSFVGSSHILVWNWKTGDHLAEIASLSFGSLLSGAVSLTICLIF